MVQSDICKAEVEKLLLSISLLSILEIVASSPLSEMNHKWKNGELGQRKLVEVLKTTCPLNLELQTRPREEAEIIFSTQPTPCYLPLGLFGNLWNLLGLWSKTETPTSQQLSWSLVGLWQIY